MEFRLLLERLLQRPSKGLIGLDIGPNSIKLLKINTSVTPYLIEKFSLESLPEGAVVNGEIVKSTVIADLIKAIIKNQKITEKNVALAIPYSSTMIKTILVDKRMTVDDIEMRAWIEANHLFPDLVGNIYLDFTILGPSVEDNTQNEVMLVVCRKEIIKRYLEILKLAGLSAKVIDVSSYALERALFYTLPPENNQSTVALLNLDLFTSTFIVVQNQRMVYTNDQSFDGQRLLLQAINYKAQHKADDIANDEKYLDILRENLSAYLRHTIHFFYSSCPNIVIEKILLSGDCATLPTLATLVQQELNVKTELADPFANMLVNSSLDKQMIILHSAAMMLCSGLALSHIDKGNVIK